MTQISDADEIERLLLQLKDGNETAFNRLYTRYAPMLYRRILSMVKDEERTEELLQDLFLKLWHKRTDINPNLSFKSYLFTIANNLVFDYLRKAASDKRLTAHLLTKAIDYSFQTEEILNRKETQRILSAAIDDLSPQQRQVFTLCKLEGKSYEEVSNILGISIATVNSHIVKANRYVRKYLESNIGLFSFTLLILHSIIEDIL